MTWWSIVILLVSSAVGWHVFYNNQKFSSRIREFRSIYNPKTRKRYWP